MISRSHIIDDGTAVRVDWLDGTTARFHAFWLYDNSTAPEVRDPGNGQRLITVDQVPTGVKLAQASVRDGGLEVIFTTDNTPVRFVGDWLRRRIYDRPPRGAGVPAGSETWDGTLAGRLSVHAFDKVRGNAEAKRAWLADAKRWGVARLSGMPERPGAVAEVARLFGYVRETNYGSVFQVRSEVTPTNLAYTNLALQLHFLFEMGAACCGLVGAPPK